MFAEGDKVLGNFNGEGEWYPGVVSKCVDGGLYSITYDDGDAEENVDASRVKAHPDHAATSQQQERRLAHANDEGDNEKVLFSEGNKVLGNFNGEGEWYPGVVSKCVDGGRYNITYDDGDAEENVDASRVQAHPGQSATAQRQERGLAHVNDESDKELALFSEGDKVLGNFNGEGEWYPGVVSKCVDGGRYNITYDDGDAEENVDASRVKAQPGQSATAKQQERGLAHVNDEGNAALSTKKVLFSEGDKVLGNFNCEGEWYPGVVSKCVDGGRYNITYDDGDAEENVDASRVKAQPGQSATAKQQERGLAYVNDEGNAALSTKKVLFSEGDKVLGNFNGEGEWYPGVVSKCVDGGRYNITYDDGDAEENVDASRVKAHPGQSATAQRQERGLAHVKDEGNAALSTKKVLFSEGDIVLGNFNGEGEWYPGVVSKCVDGGRYNITYDDGDVEENVDASRVKAHPGQSATAKQQERGLAHVNDESDKELALFSEGDKVLGNFNGEGEWYPGVVSKCVDGGRYNITYDDGDAEENVDASRVKAHPGQSATAQRQARGLAHVNDESDKVLALFSEGDKVLGNFNGEGEWYPGVVSKCVDGGRYNITYDDGDAEENVDASRVKAHPGQSATAKQQERGLAHVNDESDKELALFSEGDKVLGNFNGEGEWYPGVVSKCVDGGRYNITYDDGDAEENVDASRVKAHPGQSATAKQQERGLAHVNDEGNAALSTKKVLFSEGDKVLGNFNGEGEWYPGVVSKCVDGGRYNITYDDGDAEENVDASRVKAQPGQSATAHRQARGLAHVNDESDKELALFSEGDKVLGNFNGEGEWYPGVVSKCVDGGRYNITYDDGDAEENVDASRVKAHPGQSATAKQQERGLAHVNDEGNAALSTKKVLFSEGDKVLGNFNGEGEWYPGVVSKCVDGGRYNITYDDGDAEQNVDARFLKSDLGVVECESVESVDVNADLAKLKRELKASVDLVENEIRLKYKSDKKKFFENVTEYLREVGKVEFSQRAKGMRYPPHELVSKCKLSDRNINYYETDPNFESILPSHITLFELNQLFHKLHMSNVTYSDLSKFFKDYTEQYVIEFAVGRDVKHEKENVFVQGDKVLCNFKDKGQWNPGVIEKCKGGDLYYVVYDDGNVEEDVDKLRLKPRLEEAGSPTEVDTEQQRRDVTEKSNDFLFTFNFETWLTEIGIISPPADIFAKFCTAVINLLYSVHKPLGKLRPEDEILTDIALLNDYFSKWSCREECCFICDDNMFASMLSSLGLSSQIGGDEFNILKNLADFGLLPLSEIRDILSNDTCAIEEYRWTSRISQLLQSCDIAGCWEIPGSAGNGVSSLICMLKSKILDKRLDREALRFKFSAASYSVEQKMVTKDNVDRQESLRADFNVNSLQRLCCSFGFRVNSDAIESYHKQLSKRCGCNEGETLSANAFLEFLLGDGDEVIDSQSESVEAFPEFITVSQFVASVCRVLLSTQFREDVKLLLETGHPNKRRIRRSRRRKATGEGNVGGKAVVTPELGAIRIQAAFRGWKTRKLQKLRKVAASEIQRVARGFQKRMAYKCLSQRLSRTLSQEKERFDRLRRIRAQEKDLIILQRLPIRDFLSFDKIRKGGSAKVIQRCWRRRKARVRNTLVAAIVNEKRVNEYADDSVELKLRCLQDSLARIEKLNATSPSIIDNGREVEGVIGCPSVMGLLETLDRVKQLAKQRQMEKDQYSKLADIAQRAKNRAHTTLLPNTERESKPRKKYSDYFQSRQEVAVIVEDYLVENAQWRIDQRSRLNVTDRCKRLLSNCLRPLTLENARNELAEFNLHMRHSHHDLAPTVGNEFTEELLRDLPSVTSLDFTKSIEQYQQAMKVHRKGSRWCLINPPHVGLVNPSKIGPIDLRNFDNAVDVIYNHNSKTPEKKWVGDVEESIAWIAYASNEKTAVPSNSQMTSSLSAESYCLGKLDCREIKSVTSKNEAITDYGAIDGQRLLNECSRKWLSPVEKRRAATMLECKKVLDKRDKLAELYSLQAMSFQRNLIPSSAAASHAHDPCKNIKCKSATLIQAAFRGMKGREYYRHLYAESRVVAALRALVSELSQPELSEVRTGEQPLLLLDKLLHIGYPKQTPTAHTSMKRYPTKCPAEKQQHLTRLNESNPALPMSSPPRHCASLLENGLHTPRYENYGDVDNTRGHMQSMLNVSNNSLKIPPLKLMPERTVDQSPLSTVHNEFQNQKECEQGDIVLTPLTDVDKMTSKELAEGYISSPSMSQSDMHNDALKSGSLSPCRISNTRKPAQGIIAQTFRVSHEGGTSSSPQMPLCDDNDAEITPLPQCYNIPEGRSIRMMKNVEKKVRQNRTLLAVSGLLDIGLTVSSVNIFRKEVAYRFMLQLCIPYGPVALIRWLKRQYGKSRPDVHTDTVPVELVLLFLGELAVEEGILNDAIHKISGEEEDLESKEAYCEFCMFIKLISAACKSPENADRAMVPLRDLQCIMEEEWLKHVPQNGMRYVGAHLYPHASFRQFFNTSNIC